jgi:hypothetical protein
MNTIVRVFASTRVCDALVLEDTVINVERDCDTRIAQGVALLLAVVQAVSCLVGTLIVVVRVTV